MGPTPTYHPPRGEECETSVEHGLPLWAKPDGGYCSRRPRPSPTWGSRFVWARELGPCLGEPMPLGKSPVGDNPSPDMTYLPTYLCSQVGKVRMIGAVPRPTKQGADPTKNKLCLSQDWRGQSDFISIHAVHADRALLPSKP